MLKETVLGRGRCQSSTFSHVTSSKTESDSSDCSTREHK